MWRMKFCPTDGKISKRMSSTNEKKKGGVCWSIPNIVFVITAPAETKYPRQTTDAGTKPRAQIRLSDGGSHLFYPCLLPDRCRKQKSL